VSSDLQRSPAGNVRTTALMGLLLLVIVVGCNSSSRRGPAVRQGSEKDLFKSIAETINTLEEYETEQILPQLRDRLNHWQDQGAPEIEWRVDPLVAELPQQDRELAIMKSLDGREYSDIDMILLQETVWLRDIARMAGAKDELTVAKRLFDWTIRNVQLEPDGPSGGSTRHYPMEILLLGRGNAAERAWIFMLLCRQQKVDAVMLAVPGEGNADPRLWLPAIVSDKQLYLFDPRLGLPIPGPGEQPVATLEQVAADDGLLRQLDLDDQHPYPWKSADVKQVVALVEGSPQYLCKRMKLIESQLTGQRRVVMSASPEAIAKRVTAISGVQSARLWTRPYEVIRYKQSLDSKGREAAKLEMLITSAATPLSKGRVRHFKGVYTGDDGAKKHYLLARAARVDIDNLRDQRERQMSKDSEQRRVEQAQLDFAVGLIEASNEQASLNLGLVAFEQSDYPVAVDFFEKRVLEESADGPYTPSAIYNLARTYEEWGLAAAEPTDEDRARIAKAIQLYESDTLEQSHGNKLRGRRLKAKSGAVSPAEPAKTEPGKSEPTTAESAKSDNEKPSGPAKSDAALPAAQPKNAETAEPESKPPGA